MVDCGADLGASDGRVVKRKAKVVGAVGSYATVFESPLVGEGGADGCGHGRLLSRLGRKQRLPQNRAHR